jgi:hypothetical protein
MSLRTQLFSVAFLSTFLFSFESKAMMDENDTSQHYSMKTAVIKDNEVVFASPEDFDEVLKVGFFRVKRPPEIDVAVTRKFAREFTSTPKYATFGALNEVNGFNTSEIVQSVRFCLERDYWDKHKWGTESVQEDPNYPEDIQKVGHQLKGVGMTILKGILRKFDLPEHLWFEATGGGVADEGSYFLNFHCYDPENSNKPFGLGAHTDWGLITVLDVIDEGLEAVIDGKWRPLRLEDEYLTINFGEPFKQLLPGVNACRHRVVTQTQKVRTSTVMFIDPRVGPYRASSGISGEGMVWDWDPVKRELINGITTLAYFAKQSEALYGKLNEEK